MADNEENIKSEEIKESDALCPDIAPADRTGVTEAETEWENRPPDERKVPRTVFVGLFFLILIAFAVGSGIYYRKNIMPEKYFMRAEAYMKKGNFEQARTLYLRILDLRKKRAGVLYNLGVCSEELKDKDGAAEYYERHLKETKNDVRAMQRLSALYVDKKDFASAYKWLHKLAKNGKNDFSLWTASAYAAVSADMADKAAEDLKQALASAHTGEEAAACATCFMSISNFSGALTAFTKAAEISPDNASYKHGTAAARAMLGLPSEPKYTIIPGKSLRLIEIGSDKSAVKELLASAPEEKRFCRLTDSLTNSYEEVEIWTYFKDDPMREIKILFLKGTVAEIETVSPLYKTEDGLCISNFLLPKYSKFIKERKTLPSGVVICTARGGGLTFYAKNLNSSGDSAEAARLRVHSGSVSIDNEKALPTLRLRQ